MGNFLQKLTKCWKSWTIWVNSISGVIIAGLPMLQDTFPQLQQFLPPSIYKDALGVVVVANIILRFKTSQPLHEK